MINKILATNRRFNAVLIQAANGRYYIQYRGEIAPADYFGCFDSPQAAVKAFRAYMAELSPYLRKAPKWGVKTHLKAILALSLLILAMLIASAPAKAQAQTSTGKVVVAEDLPQLIPRSGDYYSTIMSNNGTEYIFDDVIIDLHYDRVDLLQSGTAYLDD